MKTRAKVLEKKILDKKAKVVVVGLGYVGLPLAVEYAEAGYNVFGLEPNAGKVKKLKAGRSYIGDVPSSQVRTIVKSKKFVPTSDYAVLKKADAIIVCVPTPLNRTKDPDMSFIMAVIEELKKYMHPGVLVVLESTTYPGTTDEVVRPQLEAKNLKVGRDFYLCFSPERIDPSNPQFKASQIDKVVGGTTSTCGKLGTLLYSQVIDRVHTVSSTRVAEMTKLIENTFRIVNIGLVNELAIISNRLGVDVWEAIRAASTKPFGYMPFYPGPGIGGHCIGIDPIYLSWKARVHGAETRFINLASQTNAGMPEYVVKRAAQVLNDAKKSLRDSNILILGAAYKKDVDDMRESPSIEIIDQLVHQGVNVKYHDPFVSGVKFDGYNLKSVPLTKVQLKKADMILILTDHTDVDYELVVENSKLIFDTRNCLGAFKKRRKIAKIIKL